MSVCLPASLSLLARSSDNLPEQETFLHFAYPYRWVRLSRLVLVTTSLLMVCPSGLSLRFASPCSCVWLLSPHPQRSRDSFHTPLQRLPLTEKISSFKRKTEVCEFSSFLKFTVYIHSHMSFSDFFFSLLQWGLKRCAAKSFVL